MELEARAGDKKVHTGLWLGDMREDYIDGRIILKWIFKKWDREAWTGFLCIRAGSVGGRL